MTSQMAEKIERWPIERLVPYARNARTHSESQIAQIAASIERFGFVNPILVDSAAGIIAGHGRAKAALKLKLAEVPVIVLDHLSDAEKRAYIIADNKLAENAGWDDEMLAAELRDLESELDLDLLGFSDRELQRMLASNEDDPAADDIPALTEDAITSEGDLWILGDHRLICGDCTDAAALGRLMAGGREDAIVTDPPYGVGVDFGLYEDSSENLANLVPRIIERILAAPCAVLTPGGTSMWVYPRPTWILAWVHPAPTGSCPWGFAGLQAILAYGKDPYLASGFGGRPDSLVLAADREGVTGHPTPKPIKVWQWLVDRVTPKRGSTVLDLFGGSGTTMIACERLRHKARLVEIAPQYCDVIIRRWQEYTGGTAIRESDGKTFAELWQPHS